MSELGALLKMLDQENLSSSTQEKKTSVWNLLQQIQPSGQWEEERQMILHIIKMGNTFIHSHFRRMLWDRGALDCSLKGKMSEIYVFSFLSSSRNRLHLHELSSVQKWNQLCRVPL